MASIFPNPQDMALNELAWFVAGYGYIMYRFANRMSDGMELLLLVPSYAHCVGSILLPIFGAVPLVLVVFFSGLGEPKEVQEKIMVGAGALAGDTIFLLTIPWCMAILSGKVDIVDGTPNYSVKADRRDTAHGFSILWASGVCPQPGTKSQAKVMLVTAIAYVFVMVTHLFTDDQSHDGLTHLQSGSGHGNTYTLWGLIFCIMLFFGYLRYLYVDNMEAANSGSWELMVRQDVLTQFTLGKHNIGFAPSLHEYMLKVQSKHIMDSDNTEAGTALLSKVDFDSAKFFTIMATMFSRDMLFLEEGGKMKRSRFLKLLYHIDVEGLDSEIIHNLWMEIDADKDGEINLQEFVELFKRLAILPRAVWSPSKKSGTHGMLRGKTLSSQQRALLPRFLEKSQDFNFLLAKDILEWSGKTLPSFRELKASNPDMFVRRTMTFTQVLSGAYIKEYGTVSHRWMEAGVPDPDGTQLEALKVLLREHKSIKYVWLDDACMFQGERSEEEKKEFLCMLKNVNLLYLGTTVLILYDLSYMSRFWTQFEAWSSMQKFTPEGVVSETGRMKRYAIRCIHNAASSYQEHITILTNTWKNKKPEDAYDILRKPDVQVTNQKDKEILLPKIQQLNQLVKDAFVFLCSDQDEEEDDEDEDDEDSMPEDLCDLPPDEQQRRIQIRSFSHIVSGLFVLAMLSGPIVNVISEAAKKTGTSPFFFAFVLAPLLSSIDEVGACKTLTAKKTRMTITTALRTLMSAACINNTLGFGTLLAVVFAQGHTCNFASETIIVFLVQLILFCITARERSQRVSHGVIIALLFPISLVVAWLVKTMPGAV